MGGPTIDGPSEGDRRAAGAAGPTPPRATRDSRRRVGCARPRGLRCHRDSHPHRLHARDLRPTLTEFFAVDAAILVFVLNRPALSFNPEDGAIRRKPLPGLEAPSARSCATGMAGVRGRGPSFGTSVPGRRK